jgi:hypothetical protein
LEVKKRIVEYQKDWDELLRERAKLSFGIKCDFFSESAKSANIGIAGEVAGTIAQLQSGVGAATLLLAGCMFAVQKIKEYKPIRDEIISAEKQFRDHVCFGLHEFHRKMG